jgi:hypothetical protein
MQLVVVASIKKIAVGVAPGGRVLCALFDDVHHHPRASGKGGSEIGIPLDQVCEGAACLEQRVLAREYVLLMAVRIVFAARLINQFVPNLDLARVEGCLGRSVNQVSLACRGLERLAFAMPIANIIPRQSMSAGSTVSSSTKRTSISK